VPVAVGSPPSPPPVAGPTTPVPARRWLEPWPCSAAVGLVGGLVAFWLTTSRFLLGIDWDNAAHYGGLVRMLSGGGGTCGYGTTAWSCGYTAHMALVPVYAAGARLAMLFGGDVFTGMRLVNSAAVAVATGMVALLVRRLGGGPFLSAVVAGAVVFTADVLFLVRTVEDDCLSLAWMSVALYLCVRDGRRFTAPVAVGLGSLLAAAALTNYPMIVWLPVVLAVAAVHARPDIPLLSGRRVVLPALVVAGFGATVALYGAWLHAFDPAAWSWGRYWSVLRMRPNEVVSHPGSVVGLLGYVGGHSVAATVRGWPTGWLLAVPVRAQVTGAVLAAAAAFGVVGPLRRGPGRLSPAGRAVSVSCLALGVCTVPAAWTGDNTYFERMDHVPLCLAALLVAGSLAPAAGRWAAAPVRRYAALGLAAVSLVAGGVSLARTTPSTSALARFRAIGREHPDADTFVFAESEFGPIDYDPLASVSIAFRHPVLLTPGGAARQWALHPTTILSPDEYRQAPPARAWLSDAARALLGGTTGP
jgi:hypothetical protein